MKPEFYSIYIFREPYTKMNTIPRVKAVRSSWWTGGIIGLFLGLILRKYDRLAGMFAGVTNGIVFGWLIGSSKKVFPLSPSSNY
jgi:hypothetical protein